MIEDVQIDIEQTISISASLQLLHSFTMEHQEQMVKDFFVIFACPVNALDGAFPIHIIPKNNETSNWMIFVKLQEFAANSMAIGIDVIGFAFHGGKQSMRLVKEMCEFFNQINLCKPLEQQICGPNTLIFEDLLHIQNV